MDVEYIVIVDLGVYMKKSSDYGTHCPVCKTDWTRTPRIVVNEDWVHCKKCKKKAEDIIKERGKVNPMFGSGGIVKGEEVDRSLAFPDYAMNNGYYVDEDYDAF